MFLRSIRIKNFRGIRDMEITLESTTVLIGENNTAKSTILDALQYCLSRSLTKKGSTFTEYDYHLRDQNSQPTESEPVEITLQFQERTPDEWPDEIAQILDKAVQIDQHGKQSVRLHVVSAYDPAVEDFNTQWEFLDLADQSLSGARSSNFIIQLQRLAPVFYLSALRDAAQEFRPRSQFWGPFVRSGKLDPELRDEIEAELSQLNQRVLDAHTSFADVKANLAKTSRYVPLDTADPVAIEALPGKAFDMLTRTQIVLTSTTGAKLPLGKHGEGTQSLSVMCLFDAFLRNRLKEGYEEETEPILALEEPEAHLHPSAIRSVAALLENMDGQKVISTHSGDLVAGVPLKSIRRLRRKQGEIVVSKIDKTKFTQDEFQKLDYRVRRTRGALMFSRCWLLVEGETECMLFEEAARLADFDIIEGTSKNLAIQAGPGRIACVGAMTGRL